MIPFSDLSLIGFGYLQEVVEIGKQTIARIYRTSHPQGNRGFECNESIVFNCQITNAALKSKLTGYQDQLEAGQSVIVKFTANYLETTSFQHCMTEEDPDHILCIDAKLIAISEVYVDGIKSPHPIDQLQVANI